MGQDRLDQLSARAILSRMNPQTAILLTVAAAAIVVTAVVIYSNRSEQKPEPLWRGIVTGSTGALIATGVCHAAPHVVHLVQALAH